MTYKGILSIFSWLLVLGIVCVFLIAASKGTNRVVVSELLVNIQKPSTSEVMISAEDIETMVRKDHETTIVGSVLSDVNIENIENLVAGNPFVKQVQVYFDKQARLIIDIDQRVPVVRVFRNDFKNYYVDQDRVIVPIYPNHPARCLVATGHVPRMNVGDTVMDGSLMYDVFRVASCISEDKFLDAYIDQINIETDKSFSLIPKLGDFDIVLEDSDEIEKKMDNLKLFLADVVAKGNWDKYEQINIEYTNQVVAPRKVN